ncbi:MAG: hypothetical protein D3908_01615, partial [Candidatus Electrothrix sp. AUS4]|nr:hypothetical protein [Candidatus Electrothrix sp. AUS4]
MISFFSPSFFKMRLILVIALVFLCFFFIGLVHRAFAACEGDQGDGTCVAYTWTWNPTGSCGTCTSCYRAENIILNESCDATWTINQSYAGQNCWGTFSIKKWVNAGVTWSLAESWTTYTTYEAQAPQFGIEGGESDLPSDCCDMQAQQYCGDSEIIWDNRDNCQYHCGVPCADQAASECGNLEQVVWDNVETCEYHCNQGDCEDEYQIAKQNCDNPQLIDSNTCEYSCECPNEVAQAKAACPQGYYFNYDDCTYICKDCDDLIGDCVEECQGGSNIKDATCSDQRDAEGNLTGVEYSGCECKVPPIDDRDEPDDYDPDDDEPDGAPCVPCSEYGKRCSSSCYFSFVSDSNGCCASHSCDCSGDPDPDPNDPRDPDDPGDNPPSDDPSDPEDGNGWLASIKRNTDTLVEQGRESNGWLEGIKHDTDKIVDISNKQL